MPKVSVIIPVYNVEKYLGECLDSVLGQTLKDIEVVCVDDGSTDSSPRILDEYSARDSRVRIVKRRNAGAGAARNAGLSEAKGAYLYFCDADDWIDEQALAKMYQAAESACADIVSSGIRYFDEETRRDVRVWKCGGELMSLPQPISPVQSGAYLFQLLRVQTGAKLYRSDFVRSNGISFQELPRVNDVAFVATAIALAERIFVDGEAYYHYRKNHGGNLSLKINAMPEMSALAWLRVRENLVSRGRLEAVRGAFCMSASQALVNSLLAITDPVVAESFFARVRNEFLPRFGFAEDDVVESARVFFDDPGPLRAFMERLAQEKDNSRRVRARLIEYSGELSRIKGSRAWRFMSFFSRLFDGGGLRDASRQT